MKTFLYILAAVAFLLSPIKLENDDLYHFLSQRFVSKINSQIPDDQNIDFFNTPKEDLYKIILALKNEIQILQDELRHESKKYINSKNNSEKTSNNSNKTSNAEENSIFAQVDYEIMQETKAKLALNEKKLNDELFIDNIKSPFNYGQINSIFYTKNISPIIKFLSENIVASERIMRKKSQIIRGIVTIQENAIEGKILHLYSDDLEDLNPGYLVISQSCLIGLIDKVEKNSALVKILTNQNMKIAVRNLRNQARYILNGMNKSNEFLKINYIDKNDPPIYGDVLILDNIEPDILVATVSGNINYAKILQSSNKIRYVKVLKN